MCLLRDAQSHSIRGPVTTISIFIEHSGLIMTHEKSALLSRGMNLVQTVLYLIRTSATLL
jgi:hypothetical protein